MDKIRHFKRLVRNMRKASDLVGRLVGSGFHQHRGHVYRLVPAKQFDAVLALLRMVSGQHQGKEQ